MEILEGEKKVFGVSFSLTDAKRLRSHADWYEEKSSDVVYACPEEDKPAWQLRNLADRIEKQLAIEKRLPGGWYTVNVVLNLLIVWLVVVAVNGILEGLLPFVEWLRGQ